ncbi:hypothetical protein [Neobacillus mesonae]|uniref:Uncharacterized protein n=1 Tax=Neobacillus mesonae TaxID=1193713 RepID=A0A3T0HU64_9BACI|nr:hypothetical protein [Neobacillus mesonae]AZU60626.1 hypothetical protein CHR53_04750 [Neobacillus mesonae]
MLALIYLLYWFFMFFMVIIFAYALGGLFIAMVLRAEKFKKEGKKLLSVFIAIPSAFINIFILELICKLMDAPSLFDFDHFNLKLYLVVALYIAALGFIAYPFIKKDGSDFFKGILFK